MPSEEWFVFSRAAASGAYGLVKSGVWWARASGTNHTLGTRAGSPLGVETVPSPTRVGRPGCADCSRSATIAETAGSSRSGPLWHRRNEDVGGSPKPRTRRTRWQGRGEHHHARLYPLVVRKRPDLIFPRASITGWLGLCFGASSLLRQRPYRASAREGSHGIEPCSGNTTLAGHRTRMAVGLADFDIRASRRFLDSYCGREKRVRYTSQ